MPKGHIIQENQRFGALREHIVHAHCHGIYAYGVVLIHGESDLELGAHAVGAAHQHRFLHPQGREVEHPPEGADVSHRTHAGSRRNVLFDSSYYLVSGLQIHAGIFV